MIKHWFNKHKKYIGQRKKIMKEKEFKDSLYWQIIDITQRAFWRMQFTNNPKQK